MSSFLHRCLLSLGILAFSTSAMAGTGSWTPLGPDGGSIQALAADPAHPGRLYAATSASVFRSDDGGDSWTFAGAGLGRTFSPGIQSLALSGSALFAGTAWEGAWRSLDEGRTWQALAAGLPDRTHVTALAVDPRRSDRVWLSSWEGIFLSDDRGETWTSRSGNLQVPGGVASLALDPASGRLYAGTVRDLFTSSDEGSSWSLVRCLGRSCGRVVVDPADALTLYTLGGGGVLRSRDGGAAWAKVRAPKGLFALLGFQGGRLFAYSRSYASGPAVDRLYWSANQGASWFAATGQPAGIAISGLAASAGTLYLGSVGGGSLGGVFRSRDGGERWEAASTGLSGRWINSVAADPLQPGILFAQAAEDLLASDDDGQSWRVTVAFANVLFLGGTDVLVDPAIRNRVWATTGDVLQRSDDGGRRWRAVRAGLGVQALAADLRSSGGVWAGGREGLIQSANGRTWKKVRPAGDENLVVEDIVVAPDDPLRVWVAGSASTLARAPLGPRVFRSTDGGLSWQRADSGLPDLVSGLAIDPENPDLLFAASGDGLFASSDGGATWRRLPVPAGVPANVEGLRWKVVASPVAPLALYAHLDGLQSEVVYRSRDGGATWHAVGGGSVAPGAFSIRSLAVDPHDPRRILAGTARRGLLTFTEP